MKVELLEVFGDDKMIANVARVSYQKEASNYTDEQNAKLLRYLWNHNHVSPFKHPVVQFRVKCPIYVERQLFKHIIGVSTNCLQGDTEITFLHSGGALNRISIKDLWYKFNNGRKHQNTEKDKEYSRKRVRNYKCRVLNEDTGEFEVSHINNVFKSGVKKLFKIRLQDGKELICTNKHRILTQDGWQTIEEGLTTKDFVATNGVMYVGNGNYQKYEVLKEWRNKGLSVKEMAKKGDCSYSTIRKWLKIHNLQFDIKDTQFKKGQEPWNKGKSGYSLNFSEEGYKKKLEVAANQKRGEDSHLWRGGTTNERGKIGQWTRSVAKKVHEKYNYTCQKCGSNKSLECHHIIPVVTDKNYAYELNNLVTLCKECHSNVHLSVQSEKDFAEKFYSSTTLKSKKFGKNTFNRKGNRLKVGYVKVESIEFYGEEETYDIEMIAPHHNFVANGIVVHNSISGRYVDFSDTYTTIEDWRKQSTDSKQGSEGIIDAPNLASDIENNVIEYCKKSYKELIELGVSKEQARTILPLNLNTEFIGTYSLLAFIHMCNLRLKKDAQKETRGVVSEMAKKLFELDNFKETFKIVNKDWYV